MTDIQQSGILPMLSTVFEEDKVFKHSCGSHAFFAWGIKIITKESIGKHSRLQDMPGDSEVMVCSNCLGPVVIMGGVMYDASEYISKEEIDDILMYGQARQHATPLKAMDI